MNCLLKKEGAKGVTFAPLPSFIIEVIILKRYPNTNVSRYLARNYNPFFAINNARSIQRAEYPDSLSYHANTLTRLSPNTIVD